MINFDQDRTVWEQVYETLRGRIESGVYKERFPIPSITQLEREFEVARMTVRKALDRMTREGLINPISGRGTYVRPREDWHPEE